MCFPISKLKVLHHLMRPTCYYTKDQKHNLKYTSVWVVECVNGTYSTKIIVLLLEIKT